MTSAGKITTRQRIIVGMSGGVDSSVAALLLREQGFQVEGLFMFNWSDDESGYCTAAADYQDARQVCAELGIPLHRADFSREYRERVFHRFLAEYAAGRTPNPDVLCNREIKFKSFLHHALRLGADAIATGHYADVRKAAHGAELLRARDAGKDQTYFLASVAQAALARTLFPLGNLVKREVRRIAEQAGFDNFAKKDSTGICFIGERPFADFLAGYLPARPGPIRAWGTGTVLGEHRGVMFYTLGQRKGLGIGGYSGGDDAPWYVIDKDPAEGVLWVAQDPCHPQLMSTRLHVSDMHWIGPPPVRRLRCTARIRYRQQDSSCIAWSDGAGGWVLDFDEAQRAATPGQFAVLYEGRRCLGGGIIAAREPMATPLRAAVS